MAPWKAVIGWGFTQFLETACSLSSTETRGLTRSERAVLEPIFRGSLDLERVRVCSIVGGIVALQQRALTCCNVLVVPRRHFPLRTSLLVHEMCHAWQFQNGGYSYATDSIVARTFGDGYRIERGISQGKTWHQLNCEQQATLIEEAYVQRCFEGRRRFSLRGRDHTEYLNQALVELRAGRGAAFR